LTRREVEVLALVAEGRTNARSARRCSSPPRPPASTSQESWPSSGSPAAARRPRSPTASASTSNDPLGFGRSSSRTWPVKSNLQSPAPGS
jgi:hypothetical protein